jgi:peptidoglycan/LPS O-acetylase OafA/YrhL
MMFLAPAWSLSLEWQFYLFAPLIVWGMLRHQVVTTGMAACAFLAYATGMFGEFALPSFLPGGILLLLTGVITRLAFPRLPSLSRYPFALIIVPAALSFRNPVFQPFIVWAAFVAFLRLEKQPWSNGPLIRLSSSALGKLGQWSYSTYLVHVPVIQVILFFAVKVWALGPQPTLYAVLLLTIPMTVLSSFVLYRYVEEPAIALGKRMFTPLPSLPSSQPQAI